MTKSGREKKAVTLLIILLAATLATSLSLFTIPTVSAATISPLHTSGSLILDSNNQVVYLRGVNYPSGFTASCAGSFPANNDWLWGACYTSLSSSSLKY